jgi:hypothetical protein
MLRKLAFAFVAATAIGASTLAPTAASAAWHGGGGWHGGGWHGGGWHGGGWHGGWGGGSADPRVIVGVPNDFYGGYDGCLIRRLVETPVGPQLRWVNVC